jgi:outer membrane protein assembly factor BamD
MIGNRKALDLASRYYASDLARMKQQVTAIAFIMLFLFSGCAWFSHDKKEKPAFELAQDGTKAYDQGSYTDAIKDFEQLKDWYPFSKYAILAELKIADSHYHLSQFAEAESAYAEFEQLHPRNQAIPYVIYQAGRCYYDQIDTVDRDQTPAKKSLEVFRRLIHQYPESPYAGQARTHITKCLQNLAGHEFYVGRFYFKSKHYQAALERFKAVITEYPDVGVQYRALKYLVQCEALIEQSSQAKK